MAKRKIIKIDENKCNGCGKCIPDCPEGAIQLIDKKAVLVSDLFCDGLGACLGTCPLGAITIEEREAMEYDEARVMENIAKQGDNVIKAHLEHLKCHGQDEYLKQALEFLKARNIKVRLFSEKEHIHSCPGSRAMEFVKAQGCDKDGGISSTGEGSQLRQWPVQLHLVPESAPYLKGADLLIAADCVPFAYANFHRDLLRNKILLVGCPKLDDVPAYKVKLSGMLNNNDIKSVTYVHMEVPCCFGLVGVISDIIKFSGKKIPFKEIIIGIKGDKK